MPELDNLSHACMYDTHVGTELRTCNDPGCSCMCHPADRAEARSGGQAGDPVTAAAVVLHDSDDGCGYTTGKCGRWRCGIDPANQRHALHVGHVNYYRAKARDVVDAIMPLIAGRAAAEERERLLAKLAESGHRDAAWLAGWLRQGGTGAG